uniref:Uncharacterized protein n=1 Tax=Desmonostoc muscorum LEGE 12446 TaxID=1828758 RepID=A0A8J7A8B8_DESMC
MGKGANKNSPDSDWSLFPPGREVITGKSQGNPVVEMAASNGTINLSEGTNKNDL